MSDKCWDKVGALSDTWGKVSLSDVWNNVTVEGTDWDKVLILFACANTHPEPALADCAIADKSIVDYTGVIGGDWFSPTNLPQGDIC